LATISAILNAEGVPTPAGGFNWTKSRVDGLLHTQHARDFIATLEARSISRFD
jgi:hypothetical protein